MNILVVGQSHVAAVREAARPRREAAPDRPRTRVVHTLEPRYAPEIEGDRLAPPLAEALREQVDRHAPLLASVIGGNAHNAMALVRHARPWDFRLSSGPDLPFTDGAEPVPEALVAAALRERQATDALRRRLLREAVGSYTQVESPPPVRDDAWIAERAEAWFAERGLELRGVAPAALRWRVWRLSSRIIQHEVEALGCRYVPAPPETQDGDGFLLPAFAGDATHGNAAYGEAVIRALERLGPIG